MLKFTAEEFHKMFAPYGVTMEQILENLEELMEKNMLQLNDGYYSLTEIGKFYVDVLFPKEDDEPKKVVN